MNVDPTDYSVDELRDVAGGAGTPDRGDDDRRSGEHGFLWGDPPGTRPLDVEIPSREQRERVLELVGLDRSVPPSEPYLRAVPEGERTREVITGWLAFLTATAGYEATFEALEHYRSMGWTDEDAERELGAYMFGVDRQEGGGFGVLDRADHLLSFAHVAWLAARAQ